MSVLHANVFNDDVQRSLNVYGVQASGSWRSGRLLYDRMLLDSSVAKQKLKATDAFPATAPTCTATVMESGT